MNPDQVRTLEGGPSFLFVRDDYKAGEKLQSGLFLRSMSIGRAVKDYEEKGCRVVAIRFDQSNNCECIFEMCEPAEGGSV